MYENTPSVVLVDDFPMFRKAMADILTATGEFQVLGQTGDQKVALGLASLKPDLILLTLHSETLAPLDLLKDIKLRQPDARVIVLLSNLDEIELLMEAIRLDANGYLLRTISVSEFVKEMRKAAAGDMAASEKITSALAERLRAKETMDTGGRATEMLTNREYDVLCCISSGLSNKEISEYLGIRDGTVKVHVKHVLKKLNFRSRVEVAVWAAENGYKLNEYAKREFEERRRQEAERDK